jgi:phosphopantothenate-cysteine ligase
MTRVVSHVHLIQAYTYSAFDPVASGLLSSPPRSTTQKPCSQNAQSTVAMPSTPFSTESYFQTQKPPAGLDERTARVQAFVERWKAVEGKRVVLVTVSCFSHVMGNKLTHIRVGEPPFHWKPTRSSQIPSQSRRLIKIRVRFLDNFSAGTRGATSAEYFLSQGYAVIFLHRIHSLRPFSRHYSHSLNPFLDLLTISSDNEIIVRSPDKDKLKPVLEAYNRSQSEGTLLSVDFQTINEYLWLLRSVSGAMAPLGRRGMFYLAAAVSDFFLPEDRTVGILGGSLLRADPCRQNIKSNLVTEHSVLIWIKSQKS